MSNVIAFPQPATVSKAPTRVQGAKTLFLHIKNSTLIIHLSAQHETDHAGERIIKN